jgi:hypothetical protein
MSKSLFVAALVAGAIASPGPKNSFGLDSHISKFVQPSTTGYRPEYE